MIFLQITFIMVNQHTMHPPPFFTIREFEVSLQMFPAFLFDCHPPPPILTSVTTSYDIQVLRAHSISDNIMNILFTCIGFIAILLFKTL